MVTNRIIFFATSVQPNPEEIDYWVDLSDNPYGGSIKYFNGTEWVRLAASGGTPDLSNYYTKTQVNKLLNGKANVSDVDSKVDDEEVKDVIKDIQFNTSNPNNITMVMFKYDGSNKTVSIPVASTSSAGIITSKDFLDFVKQHQLQELHTEMIDTFADIRAKYQKKLIAGLNIEIDQETNVISASGDLAVQWDNITGKPDFKPVATSGDYNDLINKLKPGKDVSISEDNVISIAIDSDSLERSLATLQSNIDKEAATARAAETKLGNDIATEKNRAQSAESANATAIANEVERATGVEEALRTDVEGLTGQVLILEKTKVNKVEGKGLSTNDYTTPEKNKLAAIEAEANKYVLPAATASALGGVKIGSNITLADGGTISITKANVTSALGVDPTITYVKKAGDTMTGQLIANGIQSKDGQLNAYISSSTSSVNPSVLLNKEGINWGNISLRSDSNWHFVSTNSSNGTSYQGIKAYNFIASDTVLCPNLNADLLDGKNYSDISNDAAKGEFVNKVDSTTTANAKWVNFATFVFTNVTGSSYNQAQATFSISMRSTSALVSIESGIANGNPFGNFSYINSNSSGLGIVGYIIKDSDSQYSIKYYAHASTWQNGSYKCVSKWLNYNSALNFNYDLVDLPTTYYKILTANTTEDLDWYGVSWSETTSNPDCTRIGNMDMHRSLPIQSMMKPFAFQTQPVHKDQFVPLKENFTEAMYGYVNNGEAGQVASTVNVMIKIPEFWYVDDYTPGTKTHNLKICPHAKPGWHHHKEAYVSAYEAFNFGNKGRLISMKSVVPTVNFTRTNGRTWARANGFDGEAKWNLYTYEEHRAICHLFLVEYATRNSQKAVNTALTPEGFRQGGLGSGCTTGTATINGAQTWSFIPTGSSDSLGSGSGEVTVTIQQTDSSGSNTSTITRKCNRYRGIENPFGHIWKHTDDIISIYEDSWRTYYKSIKPDQFATNKNNSYKPLTSAAVVTGYKTEIRVTPTCDFFAEACTNGSETTYWCDYNWDNTDTSEHCLLIGGCSDSGGGAGLFRLNSDHGVGRSSAYIGSRLTYLPWAE